jgi:hypothetical protein
MIQLAPAGGFGDEQRGNMGGIYNFSNAVHCCSKLFAEGGVAFENYLNESKDFKAYKTEAKERHARGEGGNDDLDNVNYNDLRLPPVKGTRALIMGSICFRLGLNLDSYNRYLISHAAQTKMADGDIAREANMLAQTLLHSLRDKFCVAYIFAAGLLTACIGDPNVFVLNHLAT